MLSETLPIYIRLACLKLFCNSGLILVEDPTPVIPDFESTSPEDCAKVALVNALSFI